MRFEPQQDLQELVPWPDNPRLHGARDVQAIERSIARFGWTNPILAQEGTGRIIAGHGRLQAALQAGRTTAPVLYLDLDDDAADQYAVADNQITLLSDWDEAKLGELLDGFASDGVDLADLGFDDDELDGALADSDAGAGMEDPDSISDVICVREGDVWILGRHRLECVQGGECLDMIEELLVTWFRMTGQEPVLAETGELLSGVRSRRAEV